MPYIANTPESSAARGDSLDPHRTCNGITCGGRPCKRSLATAKFIGSPDTKSAVAASKSRVEAFCWQHKDQAQSPKSLVLRRTTSYDTLIERLQILDLNQPSNGVDHSKLHGEGHVRTASRHQGPSQLGKRRRPLNFSTLFCCLGLPDDNGDRLEIVRHKTRLSTTFRPDVSSKLHAPTNGPGSLPACQTALPEQLAMVPQSLPSNIRSQLLQELLKPISSFDEEGYIYMYRQVEGAGFNSLEGNIAVAQLKLRRRGYASGRQTDRLGLAQTEVKSFVQDKILVKIGYTTNVQSRLSAWSGKCGAKVELLRYYPHISSKSEISQPKKVPSCHRVERLIHIELADKRVQQKCGCGSIHREWFEIESSVQAVNAVDDVIRKWVSWAERRRVASR